MAKSAFTDAQVFALYAALYDRRVADPDGVHVDLDDVALYGADGRWLSRATNEADHAAMAGMLLMGEEGIGLHDPVTRKSVLDLAALIRRAAQETTALAVDATPATDAEMRAHGSALADDMLAQMDAAIALNPAVAAVLPTTAADRAAYKAGVERAMDNMAEARGAVASVLQGNTSPEAIGLAVNAAVRATAGILKALPLPGPAKAAANAVYLATYLVPGIVAAAKGEGDPGELLTIATQTIASILTWGLSDYLIDYGAPVVLAVAQQAQANGTTLQTLTWESFNTAVVEGIVHSNGGTMPEWWYAAQSGNTNTDTSEFEAAQEAARPPTAADHPRGIRAP